MSDRLTEIKTEIARLSAELISLDPISALTVRELAARVGISPATAHRFKSGKAVDIPTAQKLMAAHFIKICPCCGNSPAPEQGRETE